jgi:hypothetical protein
MPVESDLKTKDIWIKSEATILAPLQRAWRDDRSLILSATSGVDAAVRLAQLAELVEAVTATEVAMSNGIGLDI